MTRILTGLVILAAAWSSARGEQLVLNKGDHICLVGNTLAERMQHDGWLETLIQRRFPQHELVFRNLGFSGDELTLRLRSQNFGSPDTWLTRCRADVVFAFFGCNESFAGPEGLKKFKADLANFIRHTRGEKYNGKTAPRLVLFSPIAHEDLGNHHLPDGRENNRRLELYTRAMAEVAQAEGAMFVDLFQPTQKLYAESDEPLTINGVHLNSRGNELLAGLIDWSLFGEARGEPRREAREFESLRQAVLDKNFHWFNRYRTVDGYSIYGGRADLAFVDGQTNRVVMQREMEILDGMTANRDRRIWTVAQRVVRSQPEAVTLPPIDDFNLPSFIPVTTNKPGPLPGGEHIFLTGEESIDKMTVAPGMQVNLYASEEQFPELINPVQMAWDTRGRLWVAAWASYPHWKPGELMDDRLLILEDVDRDGRADRVKTFADGLHNPTGFEFWNGGVIVGMAPDLLFLEDTDGDDAADVRRRILHGLDSADTHHTANSFVLSPGGSLFMQEGTFHHTQVETPYGPPVRCANAGVFRYEPRTQKFEVYVSFGFANPHGHVFDRWGQDFVHDGTGAQPYHATLFSGHVEFPRKHARPPQVYQQRTRPCPATEILSSRHFPDEMQGNLLVGNVIGVQGILRYKLNDASSSFAGSEAEPIVSSSDPSFRPVDLEVGLDGALYFTDWQNPVIGHMQHNLRDPSRDQLHGRVYRITYPGRPLLAPPAIAGEPIRNLLELLKEPEDRVRYGARIELSARETDHVIAAVNQWIAGLDKADPEHEHHLLEALWVHQSHNVVDEDLLERMLASPDFRARAAAVKVLCDWRDRVEYSLDTLKKLAADEHPRVRLEAVRAASFFTAPDAVEVPLIAAELPGDPYLDYTRGETLATLEPHWKRALAEGRPIEFISDAGARFFLKNVGAEQLLSMPRDRGVYLELLFREGLHDEHRHEALAGLARLRNTTELRVLLDAIESLDEQQHTAIVYDLIRLLTTRDPAELATARDELEQMAAAASLPVVRQIGWVALITADAGVDAAWKLAASSVNSLRDLLGAMPLIPDPSLRAGLYPKVAPLMEGLPDNLKSPDGGSPDALGRFVRIELPRRGTLTLAEVEVYSDGVNVARGGAASQRNTAHGGEASRGIDGNTDGGWGAGGQTHSRENTREPWWEVDLGRDVPIDRIVIYNRTDGDLGRRLDGFTLKVLDSRRRDVFQQQNVAAPRPKMECTVGGSGPERLIRRAAMNALTSVRGHEAETFHALSRFIRDDVDRPAAIRALQRIGRQHWPSADAQPLIDSLLANLREVPVPDRTSPAALDALELAGSLAALLPVDQARQVRAELGELGVRVIRIGAVPHRMAYDKERLVVRAGKPVEIVFENTDIMPHNLVITAPGAMEHIGLSAEATATQPGALERGYVPQSNKILLASRLLQPNDSQKLSFNAPDRPGVYPYVCTYPGHWRRMYGALYVVEDLDGYLADPEAYLASNPLPIVDDMLKFNRPRTEWKVEDLAPAVQELASGRAFGGGKQMFRVASCVACHKLNGDGIAFGPDLAKLDAKFGPLDVLQELIDPSARINEKYVSSVFELDSGKVVTGLIVDETPEAVKVVENPLASAEPRVLKKSEIVERVQSKTSIMPKGLLDKLTRDEILDLIAYVSARGDQSHHLFHGGRGHAHVGHSH